MLRGNLRRPKTISENAMMNKDVKIAGDAAIQKPVLVEKHQKNVVIVHNELEKDVILTRRISPTDAEMKCVEMADDIYRYLVSHEKKYILPEEYMNGGQPTSKMRRILVDWLVQVHARFHLLPETLHLCIFVLDQMLAKKVVGKADLQLLGVACMFVASKFEEVFMPDVYDYEYITENAFNKKQILQMEQLILNSLQFDLSCPSSLVFGRCISRMISDDENAQIDANAFYLTYNMSKYLAELSFLESSMSSMAPSRVAQAAFSIALQLCPADGVDVKLAERRMIKKMESSQEELETNVKLLAQTILKQLSQNKLIAVKSKYQSTKMAQVANLINAEAVEKIEALASE